ncbi:hypothetical protein GCM10008171_09940 [Methylopila jiangsuensis]|uniref:DUF2147 domain-containing protein n=1 Tax=Methylopila jiangsuensis TaxID=586230 RepID=A0A9W6JH53_9HYPH|nr:DUF2147 domain-containing protein [Methylopila jiangsuensis]MDR6285983.1 uncharacterized protein (DUF2147 family) [Methylopila jiangsuensis]GLK75740.1 hypothetical protein GCM10008171_09940 [Methylopila jiangsuensis]
MTTTLSMGAGRTGLAALAALLILGAGPASADPAGQWTTPKARVKISDCGGGLCATVIALNEPNDADGQPKVDRNNPDKAKQNRPIIGLSILTGMKPSGDQWLGRIYNPEDGRTYKAYVTEQGGALKVQGCALGGLVCKTQVWKRG